MPSNNRGLVSGRHHRLIIFPLTLHMSQIRSVITRSVPLVQTSPPAFHLTHTQASELRTTWHPGPALSGLPLAPLFQSGHVTAHASHSLANSPARTPHEELALVARSADYLGRPDKAVPPLG